MKIKIVNTQNKLLILISNLNPKTVRNLVVVIVIEIKCCKTQTAICLISLLQNRHFNQLNNFTVQYVIFMFEE